MYEVANIPGWALDLVAALERHEEVHPKGAGHPATQSCVNHILNRIPTEVRCYAAGWNAALNYMVEQNDD